MLVEQMEKTAEPASIRSPFQRGFIPAGGKASGWRPPLKDSGSPFALPRRLGYAIAHLATRLLLPYAKPELQTHQDFNPLKAEVLMCCSQLEPGTYSL